MRCSSLLLLRALLCCLGYGTAAVNFSSLHAAEPTKETSASTGAINILGQIRHPGSQPWKSGWSLHDAIDAAGGFTDLAKTTGVVVTRIDTAGHSKRTTVDCSVAASATAAAPSADFKLLAGDIIYIPAAAPAARAK